jgi:hypothetical protein
LKSKDRGFTIAPKKYEYFFGRVTGRDANRSKQIRDILESIGIDDTPAGREVLEEIKRKEMKDNILLFFFSFGHEGWRKTNPYGVTVNRTVEIGHVRLNIGYFYENGDLCAIPKVTTIIPEVFK